MRSAVPAVLIATVVGMLSVAVVTVVGLHRSGLYALPGDRIIVWFPRGTSGNRALRTIVRAGATLSRPVSSSHGGIYRIYVLDAAAPRRLARSAWVLRDPLDGVAQCFGFARRAEPER